MNNVLCNQNAKLNLEILITQKLLIEEKKIER